jgi:hypothetical protein
LSRAAGGAAISHSPTGKHLFSTSAFEALAQRSGVFRLDKYPPYQAKSDLILLAFEPVNAREQTYFQ